MCEYCGCQENRAIRQLTVEHDRALDHVRELEVAAREPDVDRARAAAAALAALLAPHTAVEEQALFPPLVEEFGGQVLELLHEHDLVEQTLAELTAAVPPGPGWETRLLHAMGVLRDHVLKEQDGVFPAALTVLDAQDWERLDQVRARCAADAAPASTATNLPGTPTVAGTHRPFDQMETARG